MAGTILGFCNGKKQAKKLIREVVDTAAEEVT
jgi:hypothetical protein